MLSNLKKILFFISIITVLSTQQLVSAEAGTAQSVGSQIVVTVPAISINLPKSFDEFGNTVEHLVKKNKTTATVLGVFALAPIVYTAYKVTQGIAHYANSSTKWFASKFFKKETASTIGDFAEYFTFISLSLLESRLLITSCLKLANDTKHVMEAAQKLTSSQLTVSAQQATLQLATAQ